MADPRALFQAKDMAGAILYAKRIAGDDDAYPILVNADGSLIVSLTSGTVSLDTTGLANSAGQTTHTTALQAIQAAVTGTLTIGSVSLSNTIVTAHLSPSTTKVTAEISVTQSVVTAHLSPSTTRVTVDIALTSTAGTVTNSVSTIPIVGRTLTGSTGSLTATNGSITATPTNRIKVYAISLTTTSATELICVLNSGGVANGLELWRATLMAPAGASAGLNLSVAPPNFLFASRSGTSVSLSLNTATLVHYSISYFDEV